MSSRDWIEQAGKAAAAKDQDRARAQRQDAREEAKDNTGRRARLTEAVLKMRKDKG